MEWEYEYDEQGRPLTVTEYRNGSDEWFAVTYKTYDENGNLAEDKVNFKNKREDINSYEYDENGNVIEKKVNLNGKSETSFSYEYDEKGRVVRQEVKLTSKPFVYEYEYEDYKDFMITRSADIVY